MFKLTVLVVLFAAVYAKPGLYPGYPPATSHVSRIDIHDKPIVTAYSSPYHTGYGLGGIGYGAYSGYGANIGYGANSGYGGYGLGHGYGYGYPVAQSYSNRIDIHDDGHVGYGHIGFGHAGYGYDGLIDHL